MAISRFRATRVLGGESPGRRRMEHGSLYELVLGRRSNDVQVGGIIDFFL